MISDDRLLKEKLEAAMVFESSDLWDSIHYILDTAIKAEVSNAISQGIDENKRAHQCGRAESLVYFKDLINDTRAIARKNAGRSS